MDINEIKASFQTKLTSTGKTKKDTSFKQIVEREMSEVSATTERNLVIAKANFLAQGERVLDLLGVYERELRDPRKTLRDIEPLVESINKEIGLIEAGVSDGIDEDQELKDLIQGLSVTVNVAVMKFQRGDYI